MIFGSLLLILVAVAMLVIGLVHDSNGFVIGSIAASLLAAIVLIATTRRTAALRAAVDGAQEPDPDGGPADDGIDVTAPIDLAAEAARRRSDAGTVYGGRSRQATTGPGDGPSQHTIPAQTRSAVAGDDTPPAGVALDDPPDGPDDVDDEDPPDEPAAAPISPVDAARVARLATEVQVIDGRPRYHLAGCVHLLGRDSEPLPVSEAIELGFTPCSLCEPDSSLLAQARRV